MRKWIILLLIVLITIPIVTAICCEKNKGCLISETCQDASCGNCSIIVYNRTGSIIVPQETMKLENIYLYSYNISKSLLKYGVYPYAINCTNNKICQGDCQVELKQKCEVQDMEGLTVMLFVIAITAVFFILPFIIRFSKSEFANYIMKKCSVLLGLFFLSLDTTIVATIADSGGLNITKELFVYLLVINWTIYLVMLWIAWTTLIGALNLAKIKKENKRSGDDEGY